ncbi:hypothetical protein [Nocardia camponoti]|uniref:Uncharacterized protein n=1 Tax=Nocardia camponoti TaxID=1616106 RepID=A0A917QIJ3_9NOCA|nr:hypothetical protein GCM10011591_25860 [Nocardia camponoti]
MDTWRERGVVGGYCALLTALIVGPLAGSGYLLLRDAVSTPRSYLTDSALGLGGAAPRAVPQDALIALVSPVIDGGVLVKAILIVALWSAGYGAAVLARQLLAAPISMQLVAATVALWNPYVAERLLQGHWSLFAGYAALPWTAIAATHIRRAHRPPLTNKRAHGTPLARDEHRPRHQTPTLPADLAATRAQAQPDTATSPPTSGQPPHVAAQPNSTSSPANGPAAHIQAHPNSGTTPANGPARRAQSQPDSTTSPGNGLAPHAQAQPNSGTTPANGPARRAQSQPDSTTSPGNGPAPHAQAQPNPTTPPADRPAPHAQVQPNAATSPPANGHVNDATRATAPTQPAPATSLPEPGHVNDATRADASTNAQVNARRGAPALRSMRTTRLTSDWRAWGTLTASFAAAGLTPTGSLLAAIIGLALIGRRAALPATLIWLATCAPWLTATALGAGAGPSDPAGVAAFAARAEPWLGTMGSLAGLGGIWNAEAVPTSRTTPLALVATLFLLTMVALGVRAVWRQGRTGKTLITIAEAAILLPALGATPWGLSAGEWLVTEIPGAGLLRDTQKYVALAVPAYALCAAAGCRAVATWLTKLRRHLSEPDQAPYLPTSEQLPPGTAADPTTTAYRPTHNHPLATRTTAHEYRPPSTTPQNVSSPAGPDSRTIPKPRDTSALAIPTPHVLRTAAALFIALLIIPLADLTWGVSGALKPVHYPASWANVVAHIEPDTGDVAVIPGGMFRRFPYAPTAPVLDPAPRLLPPDVLQTGELNVRNNTVSGEGGRARTVENLLLAGAPAAKLADQGVGWILIEKSTPGPRGKSETTLATAQLAYDAPDLALYRIENPHHFNATRQSRAAALAAHALWASLMLIGLLATAFAPRTSRSQQLT